MKFVHIADLHFDIPFTTMSSKGLAEQRRLEQRNAFKRIIEYIKNNNIEFLFIAGDLYENEYIRLSTIDYINKLFEEIPNTKILISPGNHDPYINNSYYKQYKWSDNVYIFKNLEKVEFNNINIYGYGFENFESEKITIPEQLDENKINILLMHADLDANSTYNAISRKDLLNTKFDYIALGHIHKTGIYEKIVYPGSMISCGFDELGEHGMIVCEIDDNSKKNNIEFVKMDESEFVEKEINISECNSIEEVIENINNLEIDQQKYYKITVVGNNNFEININTILKNVEADNIIKIKDCTKINYDLEKIAKENSLKGIFVKELLKTINEDKSNLEDVMAAIEIGLNAM